MSNELAQLVQDLADSNRGYRDLVPMLDIAAETVRLGRHLTTDEFHAVCDKYHHDRGMVLRPTAEQERARIVAFLACIDYEDWDLCDYRLAIEAGEHWLEEGDEWSVIDEVSDEQAAVFEEIYKPRCWPKMTIDPITTEIHKPQSRKESTP